MRRKYCKYSESSTLSDRAKRLKVPLWELREMLGGRPSEAKLSRMLRGIDGMPSWIKSKVREYLDYIEFGPELSSILHKVTEDVFVETFEKPSRCKGSSDALEIGLTEAGKNEKESEKN